MANKSVPLTDLNDPRHGKYTTYINYGCRCNKCREAMRQNRADRRAETQAAMRKAELAAAVQTEYEVRVAQKLQEARDTRHARILTLGPKAIALYEERQSKYLVTLGEKHPDDYDDYEEADKI